LIYSALFFTWTFIIVWLSLTPRPPIIETSFLGWDKFQHFVAYGLLTLLGGLALGGFMRGRMRTWLTAAVVATAFGGLMEIAQWLFTRNRTAEWGDLLADLAGATAVYLFFKLRTRP
jgi:VanZ family protein